MAKIKMSSVGITAISGKAGGTVFSRNRGGAYAKNFVMPSNTFSVARQAVRSIFGLLASTWRTLTEAQRKSFAEQAPFYKKLDVFADLRQLSPNALFQKLNMQLLPVGLPLITTAVAPQGTNAIVSSSGTNAVTITPPSLVLTNGLEASNTELLNDYVIEATPPVPASIKNVSNLYRIFASPANADYARPVGTSFSTDAFFGSGAEGYAAYASQFGTPTVGSIIHFRSKAVNSVTGEVSAYWYQSIEVLAVPEA